MDPITQKILARKAERQKRATFAAAGRKRTTSSSFDNEPIVEAERQATSTPPTAKPEQLNQSDVGTFSPKRRRLDSPTTPTPTPTNESAVPSLAAMQQQEQRRNDDELFSPARKALSDSLRRQHIDERSSDEFEFEFEWEDGGGGDADDSSSSTSTLSSSRFDAARLLAPNRDEEIRVFGRRSSFSPGHLPLPASSMKRSRLDSGAGTTAPSSRSSSRSGSVGSSEGGPPAQLKKSYSVTMMMENSALRALHENDSMKLLLQEVAIQEDIERQASCALDHVRGASKGVGAELEGERLLRIAAERRAASLEKMESLRRGANEDAFEVSSCVASIVLSDISFPLDPEFVSSLKHKYDHKCFSFFCLVRLDDTSIAGTHLLSTHEKDFKADLRFSNRIVLHGADPQFKISLEVYGMHTQLSQDEYKKLHQDSSLNRRQKLQSLLASARHNSPFSKLSTSKKLQAIFGRQTRRRSLKLSGRKLNVKGSGDKRTSRFVCLGKVELTPANCKMTTFQLQELSGECLLGPLHLKTKIDLESTVTHTGFMTCHDGTLWNRRWAQLENGVLKFWKYPEDIKQQLPCLESVSLLDFVGGTVSVASKEECVRANGLLLATPSSSQKELMTADSKEERLEWFEALQEVLSGFSNWKKLLCSTI